MSVDLDQNMLAASRERLMQIKAVQGAAASVFEFVALISDIVRSQIWQG